MYLNWLVVCGWLSWAHTAYCRHIVQSQRMKNHWWFFSAVLYAHSHSRFNNLGGVFLLCTLLFLILLRLIVHFTPFRYAGIAMQQPFGRIDWTYTPSLLEEMWTVLMLIGGYCISRYVVNTQSLNQSLDGIHENNVFDFHELLKRCVNVFLLISALFAAVDIARLYFISVVFRFTSFRCCLLYIFDFCCCCDGRRYYYLLLLIELTNSNGDLYYHYV